MKATYIFFVFLVVLTWVPIIIILVCLGFGFGLIACFIDGILAKPNWLRKYATKPLKVYNRFLLSFFHQAKKAIS